MNVAKIRTDLVPSSWVAELVQQAAELSVVWSQGQSGLNHLPRFIVTLSLASHRG